jgi:hypothetical protein
MLYFDAAGGFVERLQAAKQRSTKCYCLSLYVRAEQGDANNLKIANLLTVEDSPQLDAGSFKCVEWIRRQLGLICFIEE